MSEIKLSLSRPLLVLAAHGDFAPLQLELDRLAGLAITGEGGASTGLDDIAQQVTATLPCARYDLASEVFRRCPALIEPAQAVAHLNWVDAPQSVRWLLRLKKPNESAVDRVFDAARDGAAQWPVVVARLSILAEIVAITSPSPRAAAWFIVRVMNAGAPSIKELGFVFDIFDTSEAVHQLRSVLAANPSVAARWPEIAERLPAVAKGAAKPDEEMLAAVKHQNFAMLMQLMEKGVSPRACRQAIIDLLRGLQNQYVASDSEYAQELRVVVRALYAKGGFGSLDSLLPHLLDYMQGRTWRQKGHDDPLFDLSLATEAGWLRALKVEHRCELDPIKLTKAGARLTAPIFARYLEALKDWAVYSGKLTYNGNEWLVKNFGMQSPLHGNITFAQVLAACPSIDPYTKTLLGELSA